MASPGTRSEQDAAASRSATRKRRAAKACDFCRQRKMKCGNESPQCTNCKLYGKECQYTELPRKARVSRARLERLEEENERLQTQLRSSAISPGANVLNGAISPIPRSQETTTIQTSLPATAGESNSPAYGKPAFSDHSRSLSFQKPQSSYYGRTSALFDEDRSRDSRGVSRNAGKVSEATKRQLMGEAAYQRQLENINYQAGKLDFDGVDPELGLHLLSLHWNRQHHSHLITYRPAFMRDMACQGPYFSKLLLNAIYYGASKFSPRPELRRDLKAVGAPFRQRVRELLGSALDRSEITTIQALLVMTNSMFAVGDERSAAWTYAGIAFRMLVDLGLHVDDQSSTTGLKLTEEDFEIRRRVFWGAFVVDKIQSLYQGRPVSLQDADVRVPKIFQDHYEELESWIPVAYPGTQHYAGSPAYSVSTFTELCKLSVIMNSILNNVYGVKNAKRGLEQLTEELKIMSSDLDQWQKELPAHLSFDPITATGVAPPPHVLSLHAMFNVLLILLHRPFVSDDHLHSTTPSIPATSFAVCTLAASKIVQLLEVYEKAFSIRHAPYLVSYATYVSATIHVRIAAQTGPGSEAYSSLRTCLSVFNENQETNWAARRAQTVILNLMRKMGIELPEEPAAFQDQTNIQIRNNATDHARSNQDAPISRPYNTAPVEVRTIEPSNDASNPILHVPNLDMDAIINSFLNNQQAYPGNYPTYPVITGSNLEPSTVPQSSSNTEFAPQYWNVMSLPADGASSSDDMLFGFNGAALDGVW